MPTRSPHARGLRQIDNQELWNEALRGGGKGGGSVDIDLDPNRFARLSQQKGKRLFNSGYTAEAARANQAGEFSYGDKKYVVTAYRDKKGRVSVRQQDGRHFGESMAMQGKKVPARVHLVEGERPPEDSGVKAVIRPLRSAVQRRRISSNVNLTPAQIEGKAKKYPKRVADRINRDAVDRWGHQPGTDKVDRPWRPSPEMKALRRKQGTYIVGGAGAMWGADKLTDRAAGKGVAQQTMAYTKQTSDRTRDVTADLIHTSPVKKVLPRHLRPADAVIMSEKSGAPDGLRRGSGEVKIIQPKLKPINSVWANLSDDQKKQVLLARRSMEQAKWRGVTKSYAGVRLVPVNSIQDVISKATDKQERMGAGAAGATAGALAMPVRDKIGRAPKKFAHKYKDLDSGTHKLPSDDLTRISSPGVRRNNIKYTTKMAASIHRGEYNPPPARVVVYDDAARFTGGQHRVHANAWSGMKDQDVEVVRLKGYYGGTEPGHKAVRTRLKRAVFPTHFRRHAPKSTQELLERDAKIPDSVTEHARSHATDDNRIKYHAPMTKKDLRMLKGKQAAYLGTGALAGIGAREMYREYR